MALHLHLSTYLHIACLFLTKYFIIMDGTVLGIKLRRCWQRLPPSTRNSRLMTLAKTTFMIGNLAVALTLLSLLSEINHETPSINGRPKHAFKEHMKKQEPEWSIELRGHEGDAQLIYVGDLFKRLLVANKNEYIELTSYNWSVQINDDESFRAFAYPHGAIVLNTGLLDVINSTEDIAYVLGHEIAHVLLQHSADKREWTDFCNRAFFVFCLATGVTTPDPKKEIYKLMTSSVLFCRMIELEADSVGLALAARACFDPPNATTHWTTCSEAAAYSIPALLSTHPSDETRMIHMQDLMGAARSIQNDTGCFNSFHHL